jgi:hypothetical protein
MPHMHWVARENKLELPNDEEEVNTRDKWDTSHLIFIRFLEQGRKKNWNLTIFGTQFEGGHCRPCCRLTPKEIHTIDESRQGPSCGE